MLPAGIAAAGAYGGYFGAAQGVLVIGLLGSFLYGDLQRANAGKNVLVAAVNGTAAVVFIFFAHVNWVVAALIAVGSAAGGLLGAKVGRKLPALALRIIIVVIGLVAVAKLVVFELSWASRGRRCAGGPAPSVRRSPGPRRPAAARWPGRASPTRRPAGTCCRARGRPGRANRRRW